MVKLKLMWNNLITTKKKPAYQLIKKTKLATKQHQMKNGNNNQMSKHHQINIKTQTQIKPDVNKGDTNCRQSNKTRHKK
jgi:hypothetical protein